MKPTKQDIERQVREALARQEIRNVDYNNLKDWANRIIDEHFRKEVVDICYKQACANQELKNDAYIINCEFGVMGLYEVSSKLKKLEAWKAKPNKILKDWGKPYPVNFMPLVEAFFDQWKQLADDFLKLKPFIVKGRTKSGKPKPEPKNPTGTCQICQQKYCIMPGTGVLFLHGYQRPGWGYVEGSCEGAQYLPYEQSCDRAKEMKAMYEKFISSKKGYLENCSDDLRRDLELSLSFISREVKRLDAIIQNWNPK